MLLFFHFTYFADERWNDLIHFYFHDRLAVFENNAKTVAARDTDIGFLGFAEDAHVAWSLLKNTPLFAGDSDNFCRAILTAAGKPAVEVEISDIDAFTDYTIKLQGTIGTLRCTPDAYTIKYVSLSENEERAPVMTYLENEKGEPVYCKENLVTVTEEGKHDGTAFDIGTREIYTNIYENITEGKPMYVTAAMASRIVGVIETIHAQNPLQVRF